MRVDLSGGELQGKPASIIERWLVYRAFESIAVIVYRRGPFLLYPMVFALSGFRKNYPRKVSLDLLIQNSTIILRHIAMKADS